MEVKNTLVEDEENSKLIYIFTNKATGMVHQIFSIFIIGLGMASIKNPSIFYY